jgi:hypothetical protein
VAKEICGDEKIALIHRPLDVLCNRICAGLVWAAELLHDERAYCYKNVSAISERTSLNSLLFCHSFSHESKNVIGHHAVPEKLTGFGLAPNRQEEFKYNLKQMHEERHKSRQCNSAVHTCLNHPDRRTCLQLTINQSQYFCLVLYMVGATAMKATIRSSKVFHGTLVSLSGLLFTEGELDVHYFWYRLKPFYLGVIGTAYLAREA